MEAAAPPAAAAEPKPLATPPPPAAQEGEEELAAPPAAAAAHVAAPPAPAAAPATTVTPEGPCTFSELSSRPNCVRVSSVMYLSSAVERGVRMLGLEHAAAAEGGAGAPQPTERFDAVHFVALGMAISRTATIVAALKARSPDLIVVPELTIMPIADSTEHTPAISITVRRPPGPGAPPEALLKAATPMLAHQELLQRHPRAAPVANDRISLEGDSGAGGGRTGRTGGGGGGRGRGGGRRFGRGRGRGRRDGSPAPAGSPGAGGGGAVAAAPPAGGGGGGGGGVGGGGATTVELPSSV